MAVSRRVGQRFGIFGQRGVGRKNGGRRLHVAVEGRQMHRPGSAMPAQQTDHRLVAGPALTHSRQTLFN